MAELIKWFFVEKKEPIYAFWSCEKLILPKQLNGAVEWM